jgi:hypothetical protein
MTRLPTLLRRPSVQRGPRTAGAAGLAVALLLALSACKDDDAIPVAATPGGAALVASQPAVSTAHVPPPPALQQVAAATPVSGAASADYASVHAKLESTLQSASACTADSECRSIAVGAKACGGPTGYRAYSSKKADPATVEALAGQDHDLAMQAARDSHQVSPCFMLADPGAHCQQSKCVTGPPAS